MRRISRRQNECIFGSERELYVITHLVRVLPVRIDHLHEGLVNLQTADLGRTVEVQLHDAAMEMILSRGGFAEHTSFGTYEKPRLIAVIEAAPVEASPQFT